MKTCYSVNFQLTGGESKQFPAGGVGEAIQVTLKTFRSAKMQLALVCGTDKNEIGD
jgi:hypothetical protein